MYRNFYVILNVFLHPKIITDIDFTDERNPSPLNASVTSRTVINFEFTVLLLKHYGGL